MDSRIMMQEIVQMRHNPFRASGHQVKLPMGINLATDRVGCPTREVNLPRINRHNDGQWPRITPRITFLGYLFSLLACEGMSAPPSRIDLVAASSTSENLPCIGQSLQELSAELPPLSPQQQGGTAPQYRPCAAVGTYQPQLLTHGQSRYLHR
jgi:hypothetical protein